MGKWEPTAVRAAHWLRTARASTAFLFLLVLRSSKHHPQKNTVAILPRRTPFKVGRNFAKTKRATPFADVAPAASLWRARLAEVGSEPPLKGIREIQAPRLDSAAEALIPLSSGGRSPLTAPLCPWHPFRDHITRIPLFRSLPPSSHLPNLGRLPLNALPQLLDPPMLPRVPRHHMHHDIPRIKHRPPTRLLRPTRTRFPSPSVARRRRRQARDEGAR